MKTELISVRCPACQTDNGTAWGADKGVPIYQCVDCRGLFYARPVPELNSYQEYYPYLRSFDGQRAAAELQIRRAQSVAKLQAITRRTGRRPLKILDVGSGPGYFSAIAREHGHLCVCGEINGDAVKFGRKWLGNEFANIFDLAPASFDVVTFFHVLEHLEDPDVLFRRGIELLAPGGLVYVHVPLAHPKSNQVEALVKRALGRARDQRGSLYLPDHLTGFSDQGLVKFASRMGLVDVQVETLGMLSAEYDPLFFRFSFQSLSSFLALWLNIARGLVDACAGGSWLKMSALKRHA